MILDKIIELYTEPFYAMLKALPVLDLNFDFEVLDVFDNIFEQLNYIFPMQFISLIIFAKFSFQTCKILMAIIVRCKSFLPTMGA